MYRESDAAKRNGYINVLPTGHIPYSVGGVVGGTLNPTINRIGYFARNLGSREPGIHDYYQFPSSNAGHDRFHVDGIPIGTDDTIVVCNDSPVLVR